MNTTVRGALLGAAVSSVASVVYADDGITQLNTIYIGTYELGTELNDVDVTGEDLARTKPTDLQDVFKGEPTVAVGSSIPTSQKIYVNGVEETNLIVTIDGSRQNNKVFHHAATNIIDPALLKAVKVSPGVATADQGPGALGGGIAFETKDVADLLSEGDNFGGFTALEFNSNGGTVTSGNAIYGRRGGFEYLGYLKYAGGDQFKDGNGTKVVGSKTHLWSGLAKFAVDTADAGRFELSYERLIDDNARPYRANIGAIIGGRPVPATQIYDFDRQNVVLSYSANRSAMWNPEALVAFSSTDLQTDNTVSVTKGRTQSLNGKLQNTFELSLGDVIAGVDFYRDSTQLDFVYRGVPQQGKERATNVGAFVQANLTPTDTTLISAGLRADRQEFTGVGDRKFKDTGFSANISGEVEVTSDLTLSAGYSNVWGGVVLAESYLLNPAWQYPAEMKAVSSDNLYLAAEFERDGWSVSGKLFRTKINDARTPSWSVSAPVTDVTLAPSKTADLKTEGFEVGLGYDWGIGFVNLAYAKVDTDLNGAPADSYAGNYLTMPLGKIVSVEAGHTFQDLGLTVGTDMQFALKETRVSDAGVNGANREIPGYEVVNIFAEYKPRGMKNLTVRGEINNLFDEAYAARGTYGQEFASVEPLLEPGRSFKLMATLNF